MLIKFDVLKQITDVGVVPVVRIADGGQVLDAAEALMEGGITIMEVTMSSTRPFEIIENLRKRYGDGLVVGLGSVLNAKVAAKGIDSGAQFIVSPIFDAGILETARLPNRVYIEGPDAVRILSRSSRPPPSVPDISRISWHPCRISS